jgi:HPt (histidine-containing phosphotransfer) domain-containing protein
MPSTTLGADPSPVDFEHLRRMTLGDGALEREVLEMFLKQADPLLEALAARPAEAAMLAHTLKGSARAIGAFLVADCAAALEDAGPEINDRARALAALQEAVATARTAIEARLGRS